MLSASQKEDIQEQIEACWVALKNHLNDAKAERDLIRLLKTCLEADEALALRLVQANTRGEPCTAETVCHVIHGVERLSK